MVRCRIPAVTAALMFAAGSALGIVPPVGAASNWTIVGSPTPTALHTDGVLYSVSCTGAKSCFAVGNSVATEQNEPLAERWNGSAWSIVKVQGTGALSMLQSVSCTSAINCYAVGDDEGRSVVERWNGAKWSYIAAAATGGGLRSVSCTSTTSCFAVGHTNTNPKETLIERWNGTKWIATASTNPGGDYLNSVSCTSASSCLAIGNNSSFTERWDGKTWTLLSGLKTLPTNPSLYGLSCTSATFCVAVGWHRDSQTAIEVWNGSDWSLVTSPNPPHFYGGVLNAVSCTSTTRCVAAGADIYLNSNGKGGGKETNGGSLIEEWDGTRWTIVPTPRPATGGGTFLGVSCLDPSGCFAVGYVHHNRTLTEHS